MKYVRHRTKGIILFPARHGRGEVAHSEIAECIGRKNVISAGFIIFQDGRGNCFGSSSSTGLESHPDDSQILNIQMEEE